MRVRVDRGRRPVLAGWLAADVLSVLGTRVTTFALPWFVLSTTGSAVRIGVVVAAEMVPLVILKALCGPALDRLGPAVVGARLDLASAAVAVIIPVLHSLGRLSFSTLVVLVAILGALRGPADAAKSALVPAVARTDGRPLEQVTGMAGSAERLSTAAGAALAGALVATVGAVAGLAVTAAAMVVSGLLLAAVVGPRLRADPDTSAEPEPDEGTYRARLGRGWAFLRSEPVLLAVAVMVAVTNLLDQAWSAVLVPVWAREHGHPASEVGVALAIMTGAAVLGAAGAAALGPRLPRLPLYTVAFLLTGLPRYLVLAFGADLPVVLAVLTCSGLASGVINPVIAAVQFERIPNRLVGRVSSAVTALAWSLMPLGGLLGGLLVDGVGVSGALLATGVVYLIATMAPLAVPAFRAIDRPRPAQPAAEGSAAG